MSETSLIVAPPPSSAATPPSPPTLGISILGGVAIGKDTSGNLRLSIRGLAARNPHTQRFILVGTADGDKPEPIDVTELILPGAERFIFRLPVAADAVKKGDIIVKSDSPFNVIFVNEVVGEGRALSGVELISSDEVVYLPPATSFGLRLFVKAVSIFDLFGSHHSPDGKARHHGGTPPWIDPSILLLQLLDTAGTTTAGTTTAGTATPDPTAAASAPAAPAPRNDLLTELLLFQSLSGDKNELSRLLPLLLLRGQGGNSLETILLLQSLQHLGHNHGAKPESSSQRAGGGP
jgi:hypothetical protein